MSPKNKFCHKCDVVKMKWITIIRIEHFYVHKEFNSWYIIMNMYIVHMAVETSNLTRILIEIQWQLHLFSGNHTFRMQQIGSKCVRIYDVSKWTIFEHTNVTVLLSKCASSLTFILQRVGYNHSYLLASSMTTYW